MISSNVVSDFMVPGSMSNASFIAVCVSLDKLLMGINREFGVYLNKHSILSALVFKVFGTFTDAPV